MKYHYDKIIIGVLIIFIFVYFFKNNYEYFFDRDDNIIPIPPPRSDSPQFINNDPDFAGNSYLFNRTFLPYTPSYQDEVLSQQNQLLQGMNSARRSPWLYSSKDFLQEPPYFPNYRLPSNVIGGGRRRAGVLSGTEEVIPNLTVPLNISNRNISPVNLTVSSFDGGIQQCGTIQKVFGNENSILPLFSRRKYNTDSKFQYFTRIGPFGVLLPVFTKQRNGHYYNDSNDGSYEIGNNDPVYVQGQRDEYRAVVYDSDIPQFVGII